MTEDGNAVIDMVRALPDGGELRWYSDDVSPAKPYGTAWVDIWVDNLFAWTIVTPGDDGDDLEVAPDMMHMSLEDPTQPNRPEVWSLGLPAIDPADLPGHIARAIGQAALDHIGCEHVMRPAWSISAINEALEAWCRDVGRRVVAVWDSEHAPSPMHQHLMAQMEAMLSGDDSYVLMPGQEEGEKGLTVRVAGSVMDYLTHLMIERPDEAEEMMKILGNVKRFAGDEDQQL